MYWTLEKQQIERELKVEPITLSLQIILVIVLSGVIFVVSFVIVREWLLLLSSIGKDNKKGVIWLTRFIDSIR